MHPNHRLSISLLLSLALWLPAMRSTMAGDLDVLASSFRWVVSFIACTIAVGTVARLLHAYSPIEDDDHLSQDA